MAGNRRRGRSDAQDADRELLELAKALNLTTIAKELSNLFSLAEREGLSFTAFTLELLRCEYQAREDRRRTRIRKRSGLPEKVEGLNGFDFAARPRLEARVVRELLNCRWAADLGRNVICVGRPGLGKTRILDALAEAACKGGYSVLKCTAAEMLEDLHSSLADGTYKRAFRRYEKPDALYLDEFGYDPFDSEATKHLFRVVCARHRKRSILLAANTGFKQWNRFFPSEAQSVATVDRLIDRATILRFTGKSFRKPKAVHGGESDED